MATLLWVSNIRRFYVNFSKYVNQKPTHLYAEERCDVSPVAFLYPKLRTVRQFLYHAEGCCDVSPSHSLTFPWSLLWTVGQFLHHAEGCCDVSFHSLTFPYFKLRTVGQFLCHHFWGQRIRLSSVVTVFGIDQMQCVGLWHDQKVILKCTCTFVCIEWLSYCGHLTFNGGFYVDLRKIRKPHNLSSLNAANRVRVVTPSLLSGKESQFIKSSSFINVFGHMQCVGLWHHFRKSFMNVNVCT